MVTRNAAQVLKNVTDQFKAAAVVGPRQSGKTTLAKMTFPENPYVSLETPDERERANRDPRLFLSRYPDGCIIDEVQRVPELLSYLQGIIDERSDKGHYILTGSQQFGMMERITQIPLLLHSSDPSVPCPSLAGQPSPGSENPGQKPLPSRAVITDSNSSQRGPHPRLTGSHPRMTARRRGVTARDFAQCDFQKNKPDSSPPMRGAHPRLTGQYPRRIGRHP